MINGKALGLFYPVNGSNVNTMLVISLVIGVMAQFYAMGIKGWWMLRNKDYVGFGRMFSVGGFLEFLDLATIGWWLHVNVPCAILCNQSYLVSGA